MRFLNRSPVHKMMDKLLSTDYGVGMLLQNVNVLEWNRRFLRKRLRDAGVSRREVQLPQGRLTTLEGGRGEPVLFLHGFGAGAIETWSEQLHHFSREWKVFAPDLFWFGGSVGSSPTSLLTPEAHADAIVSYLQQRKSGPVHVVGLSFGGLVSLWLAKKAPEHVRSLTLVDSAGLEPTAREEALIRDNFSFAGGELERLLIPESTNQLRQFLKAVFYSPRYIPEFACRQVLQYDFWAHAAQKKAIASYLQNNFFPLQELEEIRVPALVLWGSFDRLLPASMGWRFASSLPDARLRLFPETGHVPPLEQPALFNRTLRAFLQAL